MKNIDRLCEHYALGSLRGEPEAVTGGLLHKMYHVRTNKGEYAIKVLNANIMKRPDALHNTINSEIVSNALEDIIPVVAAKCIAEKYVTEFDGSFYVLFDWLDGKSVFAPDITEYHCEQVGRILGKIHSVNLEVASIERKQNSRAAYDWNMFLEKAGQCNTECYLLLQENLADILRWDNQVVSALQQASQNQVISHRDLDPKNVMWKVDKPYLIDWEAAGYVNPFQELIEVLNYWITEETGNYSKTKFDALLQAYTENMSIADVNWDVVLTCSLDGMLGWLEYSVKRALGMEGNSAGDLREGLWQTKGTIEELKKQESQMELLKSWLIGSKGTAAGLFRFR